MKFNAFKYFIDNYIDKHFRLDIGKIKISKADGYSHNVRVCEICCKLIQEDNTNFICQPRFKKGIRPDIVFNRGNIIYVIEVRNTETDKRSMAKMKKLAKELKNCVIYIDANTPIEEEIIKIK